MFRLRNDLYCVEWGVKLYTHSLTYLRHVPIALLEKGFCQFQTFGHEGDYEVLDQNQFV